MLTEGDSYKEVQLGPKTFSVPKNWTTKKVEETCENLDRKRVPIKESKRTDGDVPYYGATGCIDHVGDYIFDEKLVLVGEDGADWSEFANTSYIIRGKSWVNNHAHVLRALDIEAKFFSELINMLNLNYAIVGTNRGKLNKKHLMNLEILSPSLPEQKKIAKVLSTVDDAIQKTEEIIEQTKELKKGLMQDLLTKGIGHEELKEVQLGPKHYNVPSEWNICDMKEVCKKITDGTHDTPKTYDEEVKGNYPFVTSVNIKNGYVDLDSAEYVTEDDHKKIIKRSKPEQGDILFTHIGASVGNVARVETNDAFSIKNVALFKPNEKISSNFLEYALNGIIFRDYLKRIIQGVAQPFLGIETLEGLKIPLPSLPEQKKIANILSTVDEKIQREKEYQEELEELKKGLMQDLMTGKVRVLPLLSEEEKEDLVETNVTG